MSSRTPCSPLTLRGSFGRNVYDRTAWFKIRLLRSPSTMIESQSPAKDVESSGVTLTQDTGQNVHSATSVGFSPSRARAATTAPEADFLIAPKIVARSKCRGDWEELGSIVSDVVDVWSQTSTSGAHGPDLAHEHIVVSMQRSDIVLSMVPADRHRLVRMPIGLSRDTHNWLRLAARRQGRHMAVIVREAIEQYRERTDPQLELPIG